MLILGILTAIIDIDYKIFYNYTCNVVIEILKGLVSLDIDELAKDFGELFKQYCSNPVFKHNLQLLTQMPLEQREYLNRYETMNAASDMFSYSLKDNEPVKPKILNQNQSLKLLMNKPKSFCRMGDGEFMIMNGQSIRFQPSTKELADKLKNILSDKSSKTSGGERFI